MIVKTKKYFRVKLQRLIFIVLLVFTVSFSPENVNVSPQKKVTRVVIDAGHGGSDPGAVGKKSKEKDITLEVALLTGRMISTFCPGVEVYYTRETDVFVELYKRAQIANNKNADLFISIHCNAAKRTEARGTEVFVMGLDKSEQNLEIAKKENASILLEEDYEARYDGINPNSSEAYIVFSLFQHAFLEQSLTMASKTMEAFNSHVALISRGVKQAPFLVLWRTAMPSILIEIGFISNQTEEDFILNADNKRKIAYSIYKAFVLYKSEVEGINYQPVSLEQATGMKSDATARNITELKNNEQTSDPEKTTETDNILLPENVFFSVQLFIDRQLLSENHSRFKDVKNVFYYHDSGYYKYVVGKEKSFSAAAEMQKTLRETGFTDAFVIAFHNEKRIDIKEARRLTEQ
jgi:N-acetylmuramoyl-L-alanine amidase